MNVIESLVEGLLEVIRPEQKETESIKEFMIVLFSEYKQEIIDDIRKDVQNRRINIGGNNGQSNV